MKINTSTAAHVRCTCVAGWPAGTLLARFLYVHDASRCQAVIRTGTYSTSAPVPAQKARHLLARADVSACMHACMWRDGGLPACLPGCSRSPSRTTRTATAPVHDGRAELEPFLHILLTLHLCIVLAREYRSGSGSMLSVWCLEVHQLWIG